MRACVSTAYSGSTTQPMGGKHKQHVYTHVPDPCTHTHTMYIPTLLFDTRTRICTNISSEGSLPKGDPNVHTHTRTYTQQPGSGADPPMALCRSLTRDYLLYKLINSHSDLRFLVVIMLLFDTWGTKFSNPLRFQVCVCVCVHVCMCARVRTFCT